MPGFYTIYVWCLFSAALIGFALAVYALKYRKTAASRPFSALMFFAGWWGICAAVAAIGPTADWALFWGVPLRFIGVILVIPSMLFFTLIYSERDQKLKRPHFVLLMVVPLISVVLVLTYQSHNLFVYDVVYEQIDGYWLRTAWSKGAWFGVHIVYGYSALLFSLFLLFLYARRAKYPYRQQAMLVLLGSLIPIVASVLTTFDLLAGPDLDLIVLGFALMGLVLAWSLSNYFLFNLAPIARDVMVENMNDMVVVLDEENQIVDVNASVEAMLGYGRREMIGQSAETIFEPWVDFFQAFTETHEANTVVMILVNHEPVYLDMSISPLKRGNKIVGRIFVLRDVTHLKKTETALQGALRSTEALVTVAQAVSDYTYLTDLLQTIVDTIAITLPSDRVTLIGFDLKAECVSHFVKGGEGAANVVKVNYNELMEGLSGWVIREMKPALSFKNIPDPRESEAVRQRRIDSFCGAIIVVPLVYRDQLQGTITAINRPDQPDFNQKDVDLMQAMANQAAVAIENARLYAAERERVVELQESNQALNAFARMVAHDLKNPLGLIVGYAELILIREEEHQEYLTEKTIEDLRMISQQSYKMSSIIDSLLLLARIRNKQHVVFTAVDMGDIVNEVLERLAWQIAQNRATLHTTHSWPTVLGVAPWIEEIWANYISNALKYGGSPPHIELGSHPLPNGDYCFWVRDNGLGLTQEQQQKLFKEFSRLAEHQMTEGTGLGLSIVEYIARRLGGRVGVESEVGAGSKFYFTLPAPE